MHNFLKLCAPALMLLAATARADSTPTHILFGDRHSDFESAYSVPIASYNRISFTNEGIRLSARNSNASEEQIFPFPTYSRIKFGSSPNAVETVSEENSVLRIADGFLIAPLSADSPSFISIYDLTGRLISSGACTPDGKYPIDKLSPGLYIAVARTGGETSSLKFKI